MPPASEVDLLNAGIPRSRYNVLAWIPSDQWAPIQAGDEANIDVGKVTNGVQQAILDVASGGLHPTAGAALDADTAAFGPEAPTLYFPAGTYLVGPLSWDGRVGLVGEGEQSTSVLLAADPGSGADLLTVPEPSGARLRASHLTLGGRAHGRLPTSIIRVLATHLDSAWFFRLQLSNCLGHAITLQAVGRVRMDHFRADGVGGFTVMVESGSERPRCVHLSRFTAHSKVPTALEALSRADAETLDGVLAGVWELTDGRDRWGAGVVSLQRCDGAQVILDGARLERDVAPIPPLAFTSGAAATAGPVLRSPPCVVLMQSHHEREAVVDLADVDSQTQGDWQVLVRTTNGGVRVHSLTTRQAAGAGLLHDDPRIWPTEPVDPTDPSDPFAANPNPDYTQGYTDTNTAPFRRSSLVLGGRTLLPLMGAPAAQQATYWGQGQPDFVVRRRYRHGDVVFNRRPDPSGPWGWYVTAGPDLMPANNGYWSYDALEVPATRDTTFTAAGWSSAFLVVPDQPEALSWFTPGDNVRFGDTPCVVWAVLSTATGAKPGLVLWLPNDSDSPPEKGTLAFLPPEAHALGLGGAS